MKLLYINDRVSFTTKSLTDEGYLLVKNARIARAGIQEYRAFELGELFRDREPLDVIRVWRPPEEVFDKDSMQSFEGKPMTNLHPEELVDVNNHNDLSVGHSNSIRRDGIYLVADLMITNAEAIKDLEEGRREISNGYKSNIEVKSGVNPDGESFDAIQRSIKGNHIALVDAGRCGAGCSINDSTKSKGETMNVNLDGVDFEVTDKTLASAIQKVANTCIQLTASLDTEKSKMDEEIDALKKEHDEKMQEVEAQKDAAIANEMTPEKIDAVMDERLEIFTQAKRFIKDFNGKGKSCMAVKREILTTKFGDSIPKAKMENDTYANARYEGLVATSDNNGTGTLETALGDSATKGAESVVSDSDFARRRKLARNKVAHRFPVTATEDNTPAFKDAVNTEIEKKYGKA